MEEEEGESRDDLCFPWIEVCSEHCPDLWPLTWTELQTHVAHFPVQPTEEMLLMEKLYSLLTPFSFPSEVNEMISLMIACDYKVTGDGR